MSEETLEMRVYIGGLTQTVTDVDVCSRFKPFGEVRSVELPPTATGEGCRGFGYVNMKITAAQWRRCVSLYTGAKWKGGKLRIEEAKEDYTARLQREWAEAQEPPAIIDDKDERLALRKKKMYASATSDGLEVEDMALVTDKNISRYPGWTKGRYGRPVLKYSVIRPSGKALNYDPAKYKSAFEKLAPIAGVEPKSSKDLQWEYDADAAAGDFEAARQMPQSALSAIEKMRDMGAKRQRLEDEAQRVQKKLRVQSGSDEAESAQAPMSSAGSLGGIVEFETENVDDSTIDAALELAPFEDAEDIALLASSRNAVAVPELQAKLASGAFDSDSESENEKPAKSKSVVAAKIEEHVSAFDEEAAALARERERMSAIVLQLLAQEPASFKSDFAGSAPVDGSDKQKTSQKSRDSKPSGNKGKGSGKADSGSSSSDGSGSDSSSGDSSGSSGDGSDQGSDKGSTDKASDDDSSSDSDEESENEAESDSDEDGAMDVDDSSKPAPSSLFGGDQQQPIGNSLFGGPSRGFKFTEALGLEADEPSAMINDDEEDSAPVTGGSRLTGPAERNLNANRLPAFFPDVDSPMFRRPEPVFQRQKAEEELEADLERTAKEMTKEYKAQLRSTVRKVQKLSDRKAPRRPN
ncbi:hypothetical protein IWW57_001578 [Coemansia sp. S610]|nr:hypothetical protein IWW57_001578 [Coemansia sp. S610]